jgi:hypothetical protein
MQFNRDKYLLGEYDLSSSIECTNANKAKVISQLDWNLFIKDYVIRELRKDLMKIDGIAEGLQLMQYVPFLTLGMFNTCAILLSQETFTNETLEAIRLKWIPLLVSANDIDDEVYEDRLTNLST